jgi:exopolyphosphatase/guanosine-5'-triphosphate,3'-diphosphate pyrophosphatase
VRAATVESLAKRYHVDPAQAARVESLALRFFDRLAGNKQGEAIYQRRQVLSWACRLHEVGVAIAQAGFHRHSAYVIANADLPGFSRPEQARIAALLSAQRGKIAKLEPGLLDDRDFVGLVVCLRLAVLLSRSRRNIENRRFALAREGSEFTLSIDAHWLAAHDLTDYELRQEAAEWAGTAYSLQLAGGKTG